MGNKRTPNLLMLTFCPDMVEIISTIISHNELSREASCVSIREALFEKFVLSDLDQNLIKKVEGDKLDAVKAHRNSSLFSNSDELILLKLVSV